MTDFQKLIKYLAIALAAFLIVSIFAGIFSAFSLIGAISDGWKRPLNSMQDHSLSGPVTELEINIGAAELIIANSESFSLSANLQDLEVEQREGVLTVRETVQFGKNYNGAVVRLTVPEGHVFERVHISSGAGKLQVSSLSADSLALNLGAGQAQFRELTARKNAMISTGAGELTVSGGALADLDLDMGVGKVSLKSRLSGEADIDQGIGEAELILIGAAEDYSVRVEKGLGSAKVDGQSVDNDTTCGNGPAKVEIDGGIGSIHVRFSEE